MLQVKALKTKWHKRIVMQLIFDDELMAFVGHAGVLEDWERLETYAPCPPGPGRLLPQSRKELLTLQEVQQHFPEEAAELQAAGYSYSS